MTRISARQTCSMSSRPFSRSQLGNDTVSISNVPCSGTQKCHSRQTHLFSLSKSAVTAGSMCSRWILRSMPSSEMYTSMNLLPPIWRQTASVTIGFCLSRTHRYSLRLPSCTQQVNFSPGLTETTALLRLALLLELLIACSVHHTMLNQDTHHSELAVLLLCDSTIKTKSGGSVP